MVGVGVRVGVGGMVAGVGETGPPAGGVGEGVPDVGLGEVVFAAQRGFLYSTFSVQTHPGVSGWHWLIVLPSSLVQS